LGYFTDLYINVFLKDDDDDDNNKNNNDNNDNNNNNNMSDLYNALSS